MHKGSKKIISATGRLQWLWEQGVFKVAKKLSDIKVRLAKDGYNFTATELGMALKRARYLTRRGKRGNYEYIQKYPAKVEDEE